MNAAHKMELFIIQDFPKMDGYHGRVVWGQGGVTIKEKVYHILINLLILPATFTTGFILKRQSKQGVAILCCNQNYKYS